MGNLVHSKRNKPMLIARYQKIDADQDQSMPQSIMEILLLLVNGQAHKLFIDSSLLVGEFKSMIYNKISQTLLPRNMVLWFNKQQLDDHEVIGSTVFDSGLIRQKKAPITQISRIWVKPEAEDQITLEKGVALMTCGHLMGRTALLEFMKATIDQNKFELLCPFQGCHKEWSYNLCHEVGNFTREEDQYFSEELTKNWIRIRTKNCPGCDCRVIVDGDTCNRVSCSNPKCKYGQFCKLCFKKWSNPTQNQCGNIQCFQFQFFKTKVTMMKMEVFQDPQLTHRIQIDVPTHRLCPSCRCPIEHNQGCKHMTCPFCQNSFCWICLQVLRAHWTCGSYNEYCGFIAPNQNC